MKKHLTLKIFSLIILNDIVDSVAHFAMKKGLLSTGIESITFGNILEFVSKGASSTALWCGILLLAANFIIWIIILYKVDLSIAMPVGSTCYIIVPIIAIIFLHEQMSLVRWLGVLCIIFGIHLVAQSKKRVMESVVNG